MTRALYASVLLILLAALAPAVTAHRDSEPHDLPVVVEAPFRPGDIGYVCSTQPRVYQHPQTGRRRFEVDHYVQTDRCPAVRIP